MNLLQGMRNKVLNFALLFETFIAAAVVYIPPLNTGGCGGGGCCCPVQAAVSNDTRVCMRARPPAITPTHPAQTHARPLQCSTRAPCQSCISAAACPISSSSLCMMKFARWVGRGWLGGMLGAAAAGAMDGAQI